MFRKNFDTVVIALIFVCAAKLLDVLNFWKAIGVPQPTAFIFSGLLFLTLVVILQHTLFEPFSAINHERLEQTTEKRKRADERKIHAESILKSYEESILTARINAMKQRERIAMEAESEEKKIVDAAKQKSQASLEVAMKEISAQIEETRGELTKSTKTLVTQLVEEVLSPQTNKPGSSSTKKSVESRI